MTEILDRNLQGRVLGQLAPLFPAGLQVWDLLEDEDRGAVTAALVYLEQHRLLTIDWMDDPDGDRTPVFATISALGLDFLSDDGGLRGFRDRKSVRLKDADLRELLTGRIRHCEEEEDDRERLIAELARMPNEGLRDIALDLIRLGLANHSVAIGMVKGRLGIA
ncbi:hypothetical protein [Aureimonas sp. AU12]|jgi:hypothetical protein|uniref:hypothetical protein n=1 Tax=Aureimonas sp. AU12 TaxID=1638161 RepID=UPI000706D9F1|nr:hypothetical protein [Aureimonas sp. AU12]BAT29727.1 hypothetical protein [Aureimonas sp. AU12]